MESGGCANGNIQLGPFHHPSQAIDQGMTKFSEVKKMAMEKLEPILSKLPIKKKAAKSE